MEETGDRVRNINPDSQEDQQFVNSGDESSELPEPELRFVDYHERAIADDLEEEARRQFEAENAHIDSVVITEESVESGDMLEDEQEQGRVQERRQYQPESDQENDVLDNAEEREGEGEREREGEEVEEEEENINTRY